LKANIFERIQKKGEIGSKYKGGEEAGSGSRDKFGVSSMGWDGVSIANATH